MTAENRLQDLAARIVDNAPVDWDTETGDDEMSTQIRNLRALEQIRALHLGEPENTARPRPLEATPTRPIHADDPAKDRPSTDLRPGSRWGHLELEELVGAGSYGEVWRAWDLSLETHVGLKILFPRGQRTEEILREARQMAKVRHENVVQVYGAAVYGGFVGIWYGFVVGKTLEAQLGERGPMGASEAAVVGIDLLHAIAAVHAAGLVHRDIKTSNVMREDGGRILLMDFGTVVDHDALQSLSATDAFTGTAPYMAPEIFQGRRPSTTSDLYSLGVLLYRLVSDRYPQADGGGRPPRNSETTPLRDTRPDLPPAFVRVVERAIAADPADRYASAGEMERDLAGFLSGNSGPVPVPPRPRPSIRRRLMLALAPVAAAVAVWAIWLIIHPDPLTVEAAVYRDSRSGAEERLQPGGRVRPGDQLFLELECSGDAFVYVFSEDRLGNAYVLFPLPALEPANPIRRGSRVRLPGILDGEEQRWDVETAGGEERLFVVACRNPLRELESQLKDFPDAGSAIPLSRERLEESLRRGISGISPAPKRDGDPDTPALDGIFGSLAAEADRKPDLWAWFIRLENPSP